MAAESIGPSPPADREAARAEALARTAARLNAQLDLDVVLAAVCEEASRALGVPAGSVTLLDPERQVLTLAAVCGLPGETREQFVPLPLSLHLQYMLAGDPLVVPDARAAPDMLNADLASRYGIRTTAVASMMRAGELIGTLNVHTIGETRAFDADDLALLKGLADQASLAVANARLFAQVRQQREYLRVLSTHVAEIEETERHQLARELHDQIGQNLTALSINLSILRGQLSGGVAHRIGARLDDSLALLEQTTERIRDVMADLRPPALDDYGLLAALRWHGAQFSKRTGVRTLVQGVDLTPRPTASLEIVLFRIAQEALTNVAKHARAGQATVTLETEGDTVRLMISDDGIGFDVAQVSGPAGRKGWGLLNMRERAEALGGRFRIESCPGRGTEVVVEVSR